MLCSCIQLTGCRLWRRPSNSSFLGTPAAPQKLSKKRGKNKGHQWRLKERKQEAQTPIRPRRRTPNAVCHFLQKLKISLKILPSRLPFSMIFGTFSEFFPQNCLKGASAHPKVSKRHQNDMPTSPKWRPGVPNWSPKAPKVQKRHKNVPQGAKM